MSDHCHHLATFYVTACHDVRAMANDAKGSDREVMRFFAEKYLDRATYYADRSR